MNWCGNGSSITSYSRTNTGSTGVNGYHDDGVRNWFPDNVGWEARYAVEWEFDGGGAYAYPCVQIRGGASGKYSTQANCNLG